MTLRRRLSSCPLPSETGSGNDVQRGTQVNLQSGFWSRHVRAVMGPSQADGSTDYLTL